MVRYEECSKNNAMSSSRVHCFITYSLHNTENDWKKANNALESRAQTVSFVTIWVCCGYHFANLACNVSIQEAVFPLHLHSMLLKNLRYAQASFR